MPRKRDTGPEAPLDIPQRLKNMRGLILLQAYAALAPVQEVDCPVCRGKGRLGDDLFDRCRLCLGWGVVPQGLALWYRGAATGKFPSRAYPEKQRLGRLAEQPSRKPFRRGSRFSA